MKLAIITTHPIQYYDPLFKLLGKSEIIDLKVFYTWGASSLKKNDPGFGKVIAWDIPLLESYNYLFLNNSSKDPGTHHFNGIKNLNAIQEINKFEPNALLVFGWGWTSHLAIIRHYKGRVPIWFRGDSTLLDRQTHIKRLFRKIFLNWVYRHVDKVFYVGKANKAYFLNYGIKESQLIYVPHAVDNSRFENDRRLEAFTLRQELNISDKDILILFAGKLEQKKDPLILLKVFIKTQRKNLHLLYVGNGELEKELKAKVKNENLERVYFRDFQNQQILPVYYQASDLFCLPSKGPGETWGLAINEAMACGKAILASNKVGCAADLVISGMNGEIFQAGNIISCYEKLIILLNVPQTLSEYGKASKKIIKNWNLRRLADIIIKETSGE